MRGIRTINGPSPAFCALLPPNGGPEAADQTVCYVNNIKKGETHPVSLDALAAGVRGLVQRVFLYTGGETGIIKCADCRRPALGEFRKKRNAERGVIKRRGEKNSRDLRFRGRADS